MRRALLLLLTLWAAPLAGAAEASPDIRTCYVLWEAQCFEIHNARKRDITHHILLTNGPVRIATARPECPDQGLLEPEARQTLLNAFNARIERIDGCSPLDELQSRSAPEAAPLVERFQRLKAPHDDRQVHILDPPQAGS